MKAGEEYCKETCCYRYAGPRARSHWLAALAFAEGNGLARRDSIIQGNRYLDCQMNAQSNRLVVSRQ